MKQGENRELSEQEREACLRCWPGDEERTGGFFVVGFIRDSVIHLPGYCTEPCEVTDTPETGIGGLDREDEEEWAGCSSD